MIEGIIKCDGNEFHVYVKKPLGIFISKRQGQNAVWIPSEKSFWLDQWVYFQVNFMKQDMLHEEFIDLAREVAENAVK